MSKYYHYFDKEITTETVNELIDRLYPIEGKINLYFSTKGGYPDAMSVLIDFLNSRKDKIKIFVKDILCSSGTKLLTDFKGELDISGVDYMLFHMVDRERYVLRKDSVVNGNILTKQDYKDNLIFAEKLKNKGILNDKQIKKFLKGHDIVLYKKDL